jgi:hypothetical protein
MFAFHVAVEFSTLYFMFCSQMLIFSVYAILNDGLFGFATVMSQVQVWRPARGAA